MHVIAAEVRLRSFPSIALRIPYCAQFLKMKMAAFSLRLDPAREVNRHFFEMQPIAGCRPRS